LLFERYVSEQSLPRRYYACSACRSRKECQFFQWADQRKSNKRSVAKCKQHEATHYQLHEAFFSRQESLCLLLNPYNNNVFYWCISKYCIIICLLFCCICIFRLKKLRKLSCSDRRFCKTCSSLLMPEDVDHSEHNIVNSLTNSQLMTPTNLLPSLCDNKTNAVSFFALKAEVISKCIIFTMRRYASTVYAMALCPCLLSVTSRCSTKMAKHRLIVDLENFTTASHRCIGAINKPFDSQLVDCTYDGRVQHG